MFGIGIGLISYPLSIHANQWTDNKGLVSYTYELRESRRWYPIDSDMPVLTFDLRSQYWEQFPVGEQKRFELRDVAFGYHQINMTPIFEEQKKFYDEYYHQKKRKSRTIH
jgi:hypothetical protein